MAEGRGSPLSRALAEGDGVAPEVFVGSGVAGGAVAVRVRATANALRSDLLRTEAPSPAAALRVRRGEA